MLQRMLPDESKARASLMPSPIIGEPFKRIAMDVVGPLPTAKGDRFILSWKPYP